MSLRPHTAHGVVAQFERRPTGTGPSLWGDPPFDPDFLVYYHLDADGTFGGSFLIPWATWSTHPL